MSRFYGTNIETKYLVDVERAGRKKHLPCLCGGALKCTTQCKNAMRMHRGPCPQTPKAVGSFYRPPLGAFAADKPVRVTSKLRFEKNYLRTIAVRERAQASGVRVLSDACERVREGAARRGRRRVHANEVGDYVNRVVKTAYDRRRHRERRYSVFGVVFHVECTVAHDFSRTFHKNRTEAVRTRYREARRTRRRRDPGHRIENH